MRYLVFDLHGPMASWGDIGYGTHRPTLARPTRSAILGLLGAALGYRREENAKHAALREGIGIAAWVDAEGEPMRDYHTIQVPSRERTVIRTTRQAELLRDGASLNTILSSREYIAGGWYSIALWTRAAGAPDLNNIREALLSPRFPLFLGRRSCPLAVNLQPRLTDADTHGEAFKKAADERAIPHPNQSRATRPVMFFDRAPGDPNSGAHDQETSETWDEPESVTPRRFRPRSVVRAILREG